MYYARVPREIILNTGIGLQRFTSTMYGFSINKWSKARRLISQSEIKYSACIKAFEMATFLDGRLLFVKENIKTCSLCNKIFSQF